MPEPDLPPILLTNVLSHYSFRIHLRCRLSSKKFHLPCLNCLKPRKSDCNEIMAFPVTLPISSAPNFPLRNISSNLSSSMESRTKIRSLPIGMLLTSMQISFLRLVNELLFYVKEMRLNVGNLGVTPSKFISILKLVDREEITGTCLLVALLNSHS